MSDPGTSRAVSLTGAPYGTLKDGRVVWAFDMQHASGLSVRVLTYGAILQDFRLLGQPLVLGYNGLSDYEADAFYMGALVGPFAGRIRNARIGDQHFKPNHGPHLLHGGEDGFHKALFEATSSAEADGMRLTLAARLPGLGCMIDVRCHYQLLTEGLLIVMEAVPDADTWINLTHHAYFNLLATGTIDTHQIEIYSDRIMAQDEAGLPDGSFQKIDGSSFDFKAMRPIGDSVLDHDYALGAAGVMRAAAVLQADDVRMEVETDQPSLHVYTGDYLGGGDKARAGVCLEAQAFPDAPNHPTFPNTRVLAGETYCRHILFKPHLINR